MTQLGIALVWCAIQVTLVSLVGLLLCGAIRRLGPPGRSLVILTSLLTIACLSVSALSPWPRWWQPTVRVPARSSDETVATSRDQGALQALPINQPSLAAHRRGGLNPAETLAFFAESLLDELRQPAAMPAEWRWPRTLASVFLVGLALGLVRLAIGLWAVQMYRRQSAPIVDRFIDGTVELQRAKLGCLRLPEVRESAVLETPGTVGWLRPLILLPPEWRSWTDQEKRVVLAHEIAHVARGDFLAWLAAQATLVLHFYHPLVHWLVSRLRLEQELLADASAAALAGGQRPYLATLAELALRQSQRPMVWPARAFLPTRDTFLRRIEMLRDSKQLITTLSVGTRIVTIAALVAAGLAAAGLRSPADAQPAKQKTQAIAADKARPGGDFQLAYIPPEAIGVIAIRVAELATRPDLAPLIAVLKEQRTIEKEFGVSFDKVEQVTFVLRQGQIGAPGSTPSGIQWTAQWIRATEPTEFTALTNRITPQAAEQQFAGKTYYKSTRPNPWLCYFRPDKRSILIDTESNLQRMLLIGAKPTSPLVTGDAWKRVATGQVAAAFDMTFARTAIHFPPPSAPRTPQNAFQTSLLAAFGPLIEDTTAVAYGARLDNELALQLVATCRSEDGAKKVSDTLSAVLTLLRNSLAQVRAQVMHMPAQELPAFATLIDTYEVLLKSAEIKHAGNIVQASATAKFDPSQLTPLVFAVQQARAAARRTMDMNNLKQIGLALHNYYDANKHLPPAVVIGPDGKTPHSWRVAILPYLDQTALYSQYRFGEPWDSPANRKVLEQMPNVYRSPNAPEDTTNSSYFAISAPVTVFPGTEKVTFVDVRDGTSNTIAVVEAKREIPWTKPVDIAYDPNGPLPELGGYNRLGFNALILDGSVRFISEKTDEKALRALFTKAGGEFIGKLP